MAKEITVPGIGNTFVPDNATDAEINYFVNKVQQAGGFEAAAEQAKQETPGRWGAGVNRFQGGIEALLGQLAEGAGAPGVAKNLYGAAEANVIEAAKYKPAVPSFKDIRGAGDLASYLADQIASSAPDIGVAAVGSLPGVLTANPYLAALGAAAPTYASMTGQNILSQAEAQNVPLSKTNLSTAAAAAVPQTILQSVTPARFLGKIALLPAGLRNLTVGKVAREIAVSGAYEGLTEGAQQAIQIAQSDPEKFFEFGPDVQNEVLEAAVAGGLLGGLGEGVTTGLRTPLKAVYKNRAEERAVKNTVNVIRGRAPVGDLTVRPIEIESPDGTKRTIHNVADGTGRVFRGFEDPETARKVIDRFNLQQKKAEELRQKAAEQKRQPELGTPTPPEGATPVEPPPSPSVLQRLLKIPVEQDRQNPITKKPERIKSETPIIDYNGRKIAVVDVNGTKVPFYQSTGLSKRPETTAGKWYPFLGIGPDGWMNNASGKDMANYYGSPKLRDVAETLDREMGDIRKRTDLPVMPATGAHADFINAGLDPVENKPENLGRLKNALDSLVGRVERGPAPAEPAAPPPPPQPIVSPPEQPAAGPQPGGSVPFVMTNQMRQALAALGYSPDAIKNMTPTEAWGIISSKTPAALVAEPVSTPVAEPVPGEPAPTPPVEPGQAPIEPSPSPGVPGPTPVMGKKKKTKAGEQTLPPALERRISRDEAELFKASKQEAQKRIKRPNGLHTKYINWAEDFLDFGAPSWLQDVQSVVDELSLSLGLYVIPRTFAATPKDKGLRGTADSRDINNPIIFINSSIDRNAALAVALHELGHIVEKSALFNAPMSVQWAIEDEWVKSKKKRLGKGIKYSYFKPITGADPNRPNEPEYKDYTREYKEYVRSKEEWFAEQVSRFLTQKKEPISVSEKFFSGIADIWRKIYDTLSKYIPLSNSVDEFMRGRWRPDLIEKRISEKTSAGSLAPDEGLIANRSIPDGQKDPPTVDEYEIEVDSPENQDPGPAAPAPEMPYLPKVVMATPEAYKASEGHMVYGAAAYRLANFLDKIFQHKWAKSFIPEKLTGEKAADTFMTALTDKMLPVGKVVDYIRAAGGTVLDAFDPYLREEQMYGVVNERLTEAEANLYKPVADAIKRNGLKIDDVNNYLYALHAPERNALMREIGNTDPERGSGMSDKEAGDIVEKIQADPKFSAYEEVRGLVRKIIDSTNAARVEAGLIPKDMPPRVITLKDGTKKTLPNYKDYVPLRGFADEAVEGGSELYANTGKGLKIRGKEDKSALGRTSKAGDIITHVMLQHTEAVIRSEKNKVGRAFHDLIKQNMFLPKSGFDVRRDYGIEILKSAPMRMTLNRHGVLQFVPDAMYKSRDDVFVFKMDGKEVAIKIGDPALRKALIAKPFSGPESVGKLIRLFSKMNRFLAAVNTSYNPEFMLTNLPRDLEQALISIGQYDVKGIEAKVFKNVRKALTGSLRVIRDQNAKGEWEDVFRDFAANGGMTSGIAGIRDFDTRFKKIQDLVKDDPKTAQARSLEAIKYVFKGLEDLNSAFENSIRVSVYKSLLDAGLSKARAAQAAKNLTVNFDKKGEYGQYINSFYLFFNASAQGMLSMGNALARSKKVRQRAVGLLVLGMTQDALNSLFGEEDSDGEKFYDKIPAYKLERNIILMMPGTKDYIAIPLPPGFSFFYNTGRLFTRRLRFKDSTTDTAKGLISNFVDNANPLGGTETLLNFLAPTSLDPLVSLTANIDFTGKKIAPENFPGATPRPNSQIHWSSTNPVYTTISDWMSKLTGGTDYVPGLVEVKPDQIEYLADFLGGGVAAFAKRTIDMSTRELPKLLRGDLENMDINNVPVVRRLVGNVSERVQTEDYMDKVNHVLQRGMELDAARKEGDLASVKRAQENYAGELKIYHQVKQLNNKRSRLASDLRKLRNNPKISPEQLLLRTQQIQKQMNSVMDQVNTLYGKNVKENPLGLF
jgi:hypothetical protein